MVAEKIIEVKKLHVDDIPIAGGKGANLGELTNAGFSVPAAFILTTAAFDYFIEKGRLSNKINEELTSIDSTDQSLNDASNRIRKLFEECAIPADLKEDIERSYDKLLEDEGDVGFVAVRSSATAEDLPDASFAGQQETYLNVRGKDDLSDKIKKCWSSLYTARAIAYRKKQGFAHKDIKLAVVIQKMINPEISGVMFTINPNTGAKEIVIEAGYGLGEAVVGGEVSPDTYMIDKSSMSIKQKKISPQKWKYTRNSVNGRTIKVDIPINKEKIQKVEDRQIIDIADIGRQIEIHYDKPMDVEWCIEKNKIYVVQARPITTAGNSITDEVVESDTDSDSIITTGLGASPGLASGKVIIFDTHMSFDSVKDGDVLVTKMTMPDMVPAMGRAVAIITDEGGMTCHAAIISRELGTPCIVGTSNATSTLKNGMMVTVDGTTGTVYKGEIKKNTKSPVISAETIYAEATPITGTGVMVNISIPMKAKETAMLPCDGVGLMRSEFLFTNYIKEHPLAVIADGRQDELIDKLANGITKVCSAFYPRKVILRTSDFKTNEYRDMKGGSDFEPKEDNPMIGWRGCSRYVSSNYEKAFMCELYAIKKAREAGMRNLCVMLPFARTIDEVKSIIGMMESIGLKRTNDFKLYLMAEIPANIFMADEFSKYCDGFSIGSNDLTQLVMGADRDSDILGRMGYFDERNEAVKRAIRYLIKVAHANGVTVGICGQGPSVYPEFTEFLVMEGIDYVSLNPDTVIKTKKIIASIEQKIILKKLKESKNKQ